MVLTMHVHTRDMEFHLLDTQCNAAVVIIVIDVAVY